jgi:hypothetical protein
MTYDAVGLAELIRSGEVKPAELGADAGPNYDAGRMVQLVIAGLRQR